MRAQPSLEYYQGLFAQCTRVMLTLRRLPVPVIARVQGIATAAGCQLVAQCDLAVASSTARFAVSGVNLGLFCSTPSVPLSRNVARKQAFEMLVTGEFIDAAQAQARGLVNRVVEPARLDAEIEALAASIVAKRARWWRWARSCSTGRGARHGGGVRCGGRDHGLQHDGRSGAGRRAGVHREAQAALVISRGRERPTHVHVLVTAGIDT